MPAVSKAQQELFGIAEHEPEKLLPRNRGLLDMTHSQLHDFAATPTKGLPEHVATHMHNKQFGGPPFGKR